MNRMVRFYGGIFHGEARWVDEYEDRLTILEGTPFSYARPMSAFAEPISVRHHKYHRLWMGFESDRENIFSMFVYEGWD